MDKKELRKSLLHKRRSLPEQSLITDSALMVEKLFNWDEYKNATNIMVYLAMAGEPNIDEFIKQSLKQEKQIFVPYLSEQYGLMKSARLRSFTDIVAGKLGVRSVSSGNLTFIDPACLDIIIVPGVVFDESGNRIGLGAGYYDRFLLQAVKAITIGICFNFCKLPYIPTEDHDQQVNYLLTEEELKQCSKGEV